MAITGPTYCEVTDVIDAMTSFNAAGTPSEISQDIVQLAIVQASSKVSAWTSNIWGVDSGNNPIAVPYLVQSITVNIAAYYATLSYRKNKPLETNDPVWLRYQDAMTDLQAIQQGQISPSPNDPSNGASGSGSQPGGYGRGYVRNTVARTFTGQDSNTHVGRNGVVSSNQVPGGLGQPWGA